MHALRLAQEMIAHDSVSVRSNAPIAAQMRGWLETLGFEIEQLEMTDGAGQLKVSLVAKRGKGSGGIAYFCHNDVVPVDDWNAAAGGPFSGAVRDGKLYGRGACDMKGSAAAALAAISRIDPQEQAAPIYFVVTSDEEHGMHGAKLVSERSKLFEEIVTGKTVGIIGEPTELHVVSAHKGACHMVVNSHGRSAHSSTAEGLNANWQLIEFLKYVKQVQERTQSDLTLQNDQFYPPTLSLNLVIKNRPAASNITVGHASAQIFMRPMPNVPWEELAREMAQTASALGLEVGSVSSLPPLFTSPERPFVQSALKLTGDQSVGSVSYATDGCWFTRLSDLIVIGPGSIQQAHRPDEWISLEQLEKGVDLFERFFRRFATQYITNLTTPSQEAIPLPSAARSRPPMNVLLTRGSKPAIEYRRGTAQDVQAVNNFLKPFVNQRKLLRRTASELELLVPSGFLALADGQVVGFSAVEIYSRKLAEIQCLAVEPKFQGQGLGSELVRRCVELAQQRGVMEVLAISSSDSFLQKLGFNYSLPDQKRALFCQLRSRDEVYGDDAREEEE
ncbi:MAG: M20/M25/M40 family metallo-hydrolase [Pirellulaceae bacterium]|nr:M20/M25/M40 family metallo-hydrolase [Pirellulaceae bacterium]